MLKEKLYDLRKSRKISQKKIAEVLGISQPAYSMWEKGVNTPTEDNLAQLCDFYGIHRYELMGGHRAGELLKNFENLTDEHQVQVIDLTNELLQKQEQKPAIINLAEHLQTVKVYEKLSAGLGAGLIADGDFDTVHTAEELPNFDLASWVSGDSMEPKFLDNSVVLLKDSKFDYDGAVYAVHANDTLYLKRVYMEDDRLRMVSINDKYKDFYLYEDDNPQIIGKVVGNFNPVENEG